MVRLHERIMERIGTDAKNVTGQFNLKLAFCAFFPRRPAPQPPNRSVNLEIREPAELLLGVPVGLQTNWRHTASALVSGFVKYQVNVSRTFIIKYIFNRTI